MNAITKSFTGRKRIRKSFGRLPEVAPMPNLIDVQRASYEAFLQMEVDPDARAQAGLQEVFKSVFPIDDFAGRGRLEFVQYELEEPKYDVEECIQRGLTFAAPLKVRLRLIVWDVDEDTGSRSVRDIKEQDVYMGDMPLMTDNGTFIINGTERVIVSQMHRSPGRVLRPRQGQDAQPRQVPVRRARDPLSRLLARLRVRRQGHLLRPHRPQAEAAGHDAAATRSTAQRTEALRVERGAARRWSPARSAAWMPRRSSPPSTARSSFTRGPKGWARPFDPDAFRGVKLPEPLVDARTGEVVADKDAKLTPRAARKIAEGGTTEVLVGRADLLGRFVAEDLVDMKTGEIWAEAGEELTEPKLAAIEEAGHRPAADAGDRPVGRALDPQHAGGGQEHQPRRSADGHLPGDAPGRAADAGDGGDAVPRPVLRPRALRPLGRRPGEDEHAPRLRRRRGAGHHPHAAQAGHRGDDARPAAS